jgi:hypothetical protein
MTSQGHIVHCYILLGDPNWLRESLSSYYELVDKIVAVYDASGLSWSGVDISSRISECKSVINDLDVDRKVEYLGGSFQAKSGQLMNAETCMRNAGIELARHGASIVLQLDTDEIVPDLLYFNQCLDSWYGTGVPALEYAFRWLYVHIWGSWYLEMCSRKLQYWDAIPGPVAIRSNVAVRHARQVEGECVRYSPLSTDHNIPLSKTIIHPSMIQSKSDVEFKCLKLSGHSLDIDMKRRVLEWRVARVVPLLFSLWSALSPTFGTYRVVSLHYCSALVDNTRKYYL